MQTNSTTGNVATHSPGPWRVEQGCRIMAAGDEHVALIDGSGGEDSYVTATEADYHLIAAAPDLLAALKGVLAGFEANAFCRNTDGDGSSDWAVKFLPHLQALAAATVAVDKAEGRS